MGSDQTCRGSGPSQRLVSNKALAVRLPQRLPGQARLRQRAEASCAMWQTWTTEAWEMKKSWLIIPFLEGLFQSTMVPKSLFEKYPIRLSRRLCFLVKLTSLPIQQLVLAFSASLPHAAPHSRCPKTVFPKTAFTRKLCLRLGDWAQSNYQLFK